MMNRPSIAPARVGTISGMGELLRIMPPVVVAELELPYVFSSKATFADDTEVGFRVHRVTGLWGSRLRHIEADAVGSTPSLAWLCSTPTI